MKGLNMRNKIYLIFMFSIMLPFPMHGQSDSANLEKINEVKSDEAYIYGEGYNANESTAYDKALIDILEYAIEFRFNNGNEKKITIADIRPIVNQINHFDGKQYNILVYIPRNQILSLTGQVAESVPQKQSAIKGEVDPMQNNPSTMPSTLSQTDEPVSPPSNVANDVLYIICNQDNWTEIKGLLTDYKKRGEIKDTGFCTDPAESPIDSYCILIDELYGVLAVMSPKSSGSRINLKTNQTDQESNYPNCKVIVWFK